MTNHQIILSAALDLLEQGIIKGTGRTFTLECSDGVHEFPEPEAIHTFACWKALGYSVKKGQHAVAKIRIWKGRPETSTIEAKNDKGEPITVVSEDVKMFMKDAFFFSASQVEPLKPRA